jgi:hypothetical protein
MKSDSFYEGWYDDVTRSFDPFDERGDLGIPRPEVVVGRFLDRRAFGSRREPSVARRASRPSRRMIAATQAVEELDQQRLDFALRQWKAATRVACSKRGEPYSRDEEWQKEKIYWSVAAVVRPEIHP